MSIADEVPFEIPESWEWVRLGGIFYHNTGKALNASNQSGQLLEYITTSNLYWNRFELDSLRQMYFTDAEIDKCTATKGDLLVCEGGDIGRAAIWPFDYDIRIQNHIHRLRAYVPVCTEYYYYIFYLYKHVGWIGGKGIGIQGLSANALHSLLFPLPPIEEQQRIVEKISEIEPYTEKYEIAESKLNILNNGFPDLLKKSVLQLAVQGKLVPQDPNDEPASVLLGRIRAEKEHLITEGKIKRDKNESVIFRRDNSHYEKQDGVERCIDEEIPFDIPETWCWARCSSLGSMIRGRGIKRTETTHAGFPCIRYGEIYTSYGIEPNIHRNYIKLLFPRSMHLASHNMQSEERKSYRCNASIANIFIYQFAGFTIHVRGNLPQACISSSSSISGFFTRISLATFSGIRMSHGSVMYSSRPTPSFTRSMFNPLHNRSIYSLAHSSCFSP